MLSHMLKNTDKIFWGYIAGSGMIFAFLWNISTLIQNICGNIWELADPTLFIYFYSLIGFIYRPIFKGSPSFSLFFAFWSFLGNKTEIGCFSPKEQGHSPEFIPGGVGEGKEGHDILEKLRQPIGSFAHSKRGGQTDSQAGSFAGDMGCPWKKPPKLKTSKAEKLWRGEEFTVGLWAAPLFCLVLGLEWLHFIIKYYLNSYFKFSLFYFFCCGGGRRWFLWMRMESLFSFCFFFFF